jgi:ubiquinone/menaquinone biosynthesis C-methylase UbiE
MRRPRFIAEQARDARGLLGRLIAFIMARETWGVNQSAIAALDVRETEHVLDVGCGHGRGLTAIAALAPKGRVAGVDPSELMVEIAAKRNRGLIRSHRVDIAVASAEDLPFASGAFDKAMCVHVVYFWRDLLPALKEIARVLKPNGRLVLLFRTNADDAAISTFPPEVYRFPSLEEMVSALTMVGFAVDVPTNLHSKQHAGPILLSAVKRSGGLASQLPTPPPPR